MPRKPEKRNPLVPEIHTPKYRPRVVPDKKKEEKKRGPSAAATR